MLRPGKLRAQQTWAKSAVETNLIFYFLAAARQIETSRKSRQETPAADAQPASQPGTRYYWIFSYLADFKLPFDIFLFFLLFF